jgi:hypothetical protein
MKRALLALGAVLAAACLLAPASAGAGGKDDRTVILDPIEIVVKPPQPALLVIQRAPIGFKLPDLEFDSLSAVGESVGKIAD